MTRVDLPLSAFGVEWDEGTMPEFLISPWGDFNGVGVRDVVARPDATGLATAHLTPTPEGAFYSVQVSWVEGDLPRARFLKITVPETLPVMVTDLIEKVDDDDS